MSAVDFEQWAVPPLELRLRGVTYTIYPPDVETAKKLLAAAVRGEVNLGLVEGDVPDEVQRVLETIGSDEHPALGPAWNEMLANGLDPVTMDRAAYYAVFYWARGKAYADTIAKIIWEPKTEAPEAGGGAAPKDSSRPKTGRRTASASRTPKAGTPTTGRSRKS